MVGKQDMLSIENWRMSALICAFALDCQIIGMFISV